MTNIIYNDKHSYNDIKIKRANAKEHKAPAKKKIYETVPFMNGSYDFSNMYGSTFFDDRELNYTFLVEVDDEELMVLRKMDIENWLLSSNGKSVLYDDDLEEYYYMAECTGVDFDNYFTFGIIEATFTAYPFKICKEYENDTKWDPFNFETDIFKDYRFGVNGTITVQIFNPGTGTVAPIVNCTSDMEVSIGAVTYVFKAGSNTSFTFDLKPGANKITIKGEGTIEFLFRREVL